MSSGSTTLTENAIHNPICEQQLIEHTGGLHCKCPGTQWVEYSHWFYTEKRSRRLHIYRKLLANVTKALYMRYTHAM